MNVSYATAIDSAAREYGLDPRLLAAVAAQETGGPGENSGRNVVGDGGHGHGLFQIDDRYHAFARTAAAMNPAENARYAASLIAGNLHRYGGNVREALSAYNAGDPHATGTSTTWGDGQRLGYAESVLRHYRELGGAADSGALASAQADRAETGSAVNGLFNAMLAFIESAQQPAFHAPRAQPAQWQHRPGLDATGHTRERLLSTYITGDEQP